MNKMKNIIVMMAAITCLYGGIAAAENRLSVSATETAPIKPAAYIFEVVFDSPVSPASHFEIIFPVEYNLKNVEMASSDKLDGTLQVESQQNTLIVNRQGAKSSVPAGQVIDLKIAVVLNPVDISGNKKMTVVLKQGQTEIERAESRTAANVFQTNNR
jgi:hypothetical protein